MKEKGWAEESICVAISPTLSYFKGTKFNVQSHELNMFHGFKKNIDLVLSFQPPAKSWFLVFGRKEKCRCPQSLAGLRGALCDITVGLFPELCNYDVPQKPWKSLAAASWTFVERPAL